jgi:hypothetical protein
MQYWRQLILSLGGLVAIIAATAAFAHFLKRNESGLPVYWSVPDFSLIAHDGKTLRVERPEGQNLGG